MFKSIQEIVSTLSEEEKDKFHDLIHELLINEIEICKSQENSILWSNKFHEFMIKIIENIHKAKEKTEKIKDQINTHDLCQIPENQFQKV